MKSARIPATPWRAFVRFGGLLLAAVTLSGCGARAPQDVLRVGMELAYPPFEMIDGSGKPSGVSVDLANALGEHLGRPVQIENIAWDGLIPALKTGRVDLVISSMTATDERRQSIDFSDPYVQIGLALLVGKDTPVKTVEDIDQPGRVVAVRLNTTGQKWAQDNLKQARLVVLEREAACVLEVAQGKADAFIYDQLAVFQHAKNNAATTRALLAPFKEEPWAIGIRKGNEDLRTAVNTFLANFRAKGGFDALAAKHLAEQKAAFAGQGIPFVFR